MIMRPEIERICAKLDLTVIDVVESPPAQWSGESRRISADLLDRCLPDHPRQHDYFLCGPPPIVIAVGVV